MYLFPNNGTLKLQVTRLSILSCLLFQCTKQSQFTDSCARFSFQDQEAEADDDEVAAAIAATAAAEAAATAEAAAAAEATAAGWQEMGMAQDEDAGEEHEVSSLKEVTVCS